MSGHEWSVQVEEIERNSIRCDGCLDEIESTHRHDFKPCSCGKVMVDGGKDYLRRVFSGGQTYTDTSIYDVYEVTYMDLEVVSRTFVKSVGR